jgi:hypothetical protein
LFLITMGKQEDWIEKSKESVAHDWFVGHGRTSLDLGDVQ